MEGNNGSSRPTEWRWDRFNAKKVTSTEWAGRNCVGTDSSKISSHVAMQKMVMEEQNSAMMIIVSEIHQLLHDAATITNMKYCCKRTNHMLPCLTNRDIRKSWLQDGSEANQQRLAWIFYYYGMEIHQIGRSLTHCDWVESKVLAALNVAYVHLGDKEERQRTCVQQLYSKKMNYVRSNIMRRGLTMNHTSMIQKEQPKVPGLYNKNFKRGKATFFVTLDERDKRGWHKVGKT
jgi:metal-dependent amidase/aminoacylase/carboxypeptidase family protein